MTNLGKVDIKGLDVTGSISLHPMEKLQINLSGNYTYQRALDVTSATDNTYKKLINTRSPILRVYPVRGRQASKHPGSTCPTLSSSRANATHKEKT